MNVENDDIEHTLSENWFILSPSGVHLLVTALVPSEGTAVMPLTLVTFLYPCGFYIKEPSLVPLVARN